VNKRLASQLQGSGGAHYDVTIKVRWDDQPLAMCSCAER
jgi:hypothetical protein